MWRRCRSRRITGKPRNVDALAPLNVEVGLGDVVDQLHDGSDTRWWSIGFMPNLAASLVWRTSIDHLDAGLEDCPRGIQLDVRWWRPVDGSLPSVVGLHRTLAASDSGSRVSSLPARLGHRRARPGPQRSDRPAARLVTHEAVEPASTRSARNLARYSDEIGYAGRQ